MTMHIKLAVAVVTACSLSSCSSQLIETAKTVDVDTYIYSTTVADLSVREAKSAKTIEWTSGTDEEIKEKAATALLADTNSDVLVEPQYTVTRNLSGGTVTVSGYPAKYTNFRPLSHQEADLMALLNGRDASRKVFLFTPSVANGLGSHVASSRDSRRKNVINVVGGALIDIDNEFDTGFLTGVLYGNYGKNWGWYSKLVWDHASYQYSYRYYGYNSVYAHYPYVSEEYRTTTNGLMLTIGAIKTLSANFNVLLGIGLGVNMIDNERRNESDTEYGMPFELGLQWNPSRFSITVGCTGMPLFTDYDTKWMLAPFAGIGLTF